MKHLTLIGLRHGKRVVRWPVLLARLGVYLFVLAAAIYAVTWVSDWILREETHRNVVRVIAMSLFLTVLFIVHDLRRDLKLAAKELPDLDRSMRSKAE